MISINNNDYAVLSVFPSVETFHDFGKNIENQTIIDSFVNFAFEKGLIPVADEDAFEQFIRRNRHKIAAPSMPEDLNFEALFARKKEILQISISGRALTERVNHLIKRYKIDLPKLTNTMLSRLKKEPADTPHKRNSLRTLAFWLGYERSNLEAAWNFETLLRLCHASSSEKKINLGARIGLSLHSRGDVIDQEAVSWLKKNIKSYIDSAMAMLPYKGWGRVKSYDITTLYIDFPKEDKTNYPASYQTSIRQALSVAHQIAVRWALSDHSTKNRFLSIGIATGEFTNLNNYLLPILNTKISGDPVVRMTDHTHQCILAGDIRTVFCSQPEETTLFNGETLSIWWVEGLWSFIYWDFIPALLEDGIMQPTHESPNGLNRFFMYPDTIEKQSNLNSIKRFFLFPQNALLGIEIAKTFYYRRRFWEANEILRVVLSIDRINVCARSLRMMLYRNMAIEEPVYSISQIHFMRAEDEAQFIIEHCNTFEEDFFCEYAVVMLSKAIYTLRCMREDLDMVEIPGDKGKLKLQVYKYLENAARLFEKGIVVSTSGYRSIWLLICTRMLSKILKTNERFFEAPKIPIHVPKRVFAQTTYDILASLNTFGWRDFETTDLGFLENLFFQSFDQYGGSVTLRAYRSTLYFCHAVSLWDVFPNRTVKGAKKVLEFFQKAINMAREMDEQKLYIYSYTRCLGEMLEPETFIRHIENAVQKVEKCAGTMEELENMDPSQMIEDNKNDFALFCLNI
jgi:hypothetical protein